MPRLTGGASGFASTDDRVLRGVTKASDYGLIGMSADPATASIGQDLAQGYLVVARIFVEGSETIANLHCRVTTAGSSLTANQCFGFVYNAAGTLIGKSASLEAVFNSTGEKTVPLVAESGQSLAAGGPGVWVHAGFLMNGTGAPSCTGVPGSSTASNFGLTAATCRFGRSNAAGNTSVPATRPTMLADSSRSLWIGLS